MSGDSYRDDRSIHDSEVLLRRVYPGWWIADNNTGAVRPTSQAFANRRGVSAMSVDLQTVLSEIGLGPETVLEGHDGFALASITAGLARQCSQGIMRKPEPDDPAHAEVFGEKPTVVRRKFARCAVWVVAPS